jgi:hypothetical protein
MTVNFITILKWIKMYENEPLLYFLGYACYKENL